MAATVRIQLNSSEFDAMLHGEIARRSVAPFSARALANARARSTGAFRDSLHVVEVQHPTRLVHQVVADSGDALFRESEDGTLARSLD